MPNRRFDWHEHIKEVHGEYKAARIAIDRLKAAFVEAPDILKEDNEARAYLRNADANLEGTYLVRIFAAFEAALRSYDRAQHPDSIYKDASTLIDRIGGRRGQGISAAVRAGAQAVRRNRNYWAHENDQLPERMSIGEAQARLQTYLSWLPSEWS